MNDSFIIDETFELEAEPNVSKIETTDDAASPNDDALELEAEAGKTTDDAASANDDALPTALGVEQIATQKRDQTTTAQDVKRDVAVSYLRSSFQTRPAKQRRSAKNRVVFRRR